LYTAVPISDEAEEILMSDANLDPFLEPDSVAIVGAPRGTGVGAFNVVENLLEFGYEGDVYPINPKADEVVGLEAYDHIGQIDGPVDHAIVFLPRDYVVDAVEGCGEKGVPAVTIVSQGFADAGEDGTALQEEIVEVADEYDIDVLGPNTMGVHSFATDFTTAFAPMEQREYDPIAVVSQTGLFSMSFPDLQYAKFVDLGNAGDVDHVDALEYFADDPEIEQVFLHIEGLQQDRGRDFIEAAQSAVEGGTAVITHKTGESELGRKQAESHTGSLLGDDAVFDGACKQGDVIRVRDYTEAQVVSTGLRDLPSMDGNGIGMMTHHGGAGIMTMDAVEGTNLELPDISDATAEAIGEMSPPWLDIGNPIDIGPATLGDTAAAHEAAIEAALEDDQLDALLLSVHIADPSPWPVGVWGHVDALETLAPDYDKPVVVVPVGTDQSETRSRLDEVPNVTVAGDVRQGVRMLETLSEFSAASGGAQ
jgi:acyl-CoA synthetase (NDP forming)